MSVSEANSARRKRGGATVEEGSSPAAGSDHQAPVTALIDLGFTENEALTYSQLLTFPGSTAYRLASLTGKSQANVTFALQGLLRKGAVLANEGEARTYDPLPPAELLERLRLESAARIGAAQRSLASVGMTAQKDRIRKLGSSADVYDRARKMIEAAEETVLIEANPPMLAQLREDLRRAAARVSVAGMVMSEEDLIPGTRLTVSKNAAHIRAMMRGGALFLMVDAREMLLAFFSSADREPLYALWGDNPLLAAVLHNAIASDVLLHSGRTIGEITSPNTELFGLVPSAITHLYSETQK